MIDYSWLVENYPVPTNLDLLSQVKAFLSGPLPQPTPQETLWVFNIGFWDIWHLAALPRKLATRLIETEAEHVFSQLELLYSEARKNNSVAFSNYYSDANIIAKHDIDRAPLSRAPFRVFLPRPFDISLTPGFENVRFVPPPPHTKAEQVRNAAFLVNHWDQVMQDTLSEWVRLPDLEETDQDGNDLSDIKDADLLLSKKSTTGKKGVVGRPVPPARREAITYDVSGYIRELIVEQQLRNADIVDHSGLGAMTSAEGYSEVWEPCIKRVTIGNSDIGNTTTTSSTEQGGDDGSEWRVCDAPDEHLFWTEFTVNRRTIFEVGRRAAELLKRHVQMDDEWLRKTQQPLSSLRKGSDGAPLRV